MDSDDYRFAKMALRTLEVIGMIALAIGIIILVMALAGSRGMTGWMGGIYWSAIGLAQVVASQLGRALLSIAGNIQAMRLIAEAGKITQVSGAISANAGLSSDRYGRSGVVRDANQIGTIIKRYKGHAIIRAAEGVTIDGMGAFANVIEAERHISNMHSTASE